MKSESQVKKQSIKSPIRFKLTEVKIIKLGKELTAIYRIRN